MVEIFVAYVEGYSAYKIVTPYKTITKIVSDNCDKAVLIALKSTRPKNVTLITKYNAYELLCKGVAPRDEVQEAIHKILLDKRVTFQRIDEYSQEQLVKFIATESTKKEVKNDKWGHSDNNDIRTLLLFT